MVGRGLGWQISDFKKILKEEEKNSEINLKKGNTTFLPHFVEDLNQNNGGLNKKRKF